MYRVSSFFNRYLYYFTKKKKTMWKVIESHIHKSWSIVTAFLDYQESAKTTRQALFIAL